MEVDRADTEVGATEVDGEVETLANAQNESRREQQKVNTFSVPFGTSVTKVGIWLRVVSSWASPSSICLLYSATPRSTSSAGYSNRRAMRAASSSTGDGIRTDWQERKGE